MNETDARYALEYLRHCKDVGNIVFEMPQDEEIINTLIEALEKHMPRKVINVTSEYDGDYGSCASCKNIVWNLTSPASCKHCGQKLNWR